MNMNKWNVSLNRKHIDTVFFNKSCNKDYVLNSLIEHDNYDQNINIRKVL